MIYTYCKTGLTKAINSDIFPRCLSCAFRYASTTQTPLQNAGYCWRYALKEYGGTA